MKSKRSLALLLLPLVIAASCARTRAKPVDASSDPAPAPTTTTPVDQTAADKSTDPKTESQEVKLTASVKLAISIDSFKDETTRANAQKNETDPLNQFLALRTADSLNLVSILLPDVTKVTANNVDTFVVTARIGSAAGEASDWSVTLQRTKEVDAKDLWKLLDKGNLNLACESATIDAAKKTVACSKDKTQP